MISTQFRYLLILIKRLGIVAATLLLFFAFIELVQAFQVLSGIHPLLGFGFIATLLFFIVWGGIKLFTSIKAFPRALTPPNPNDYKDIETDKYKKVYLIYLKKYVNELIANPALGGTIRDELKEKVKLFSKQPNVVKIAWIEQECIIPAFAELDKKADLIVRNTVRDTMTAVILSPFRSLDSFVVISRNGQMFMELVKLYNHHPGILQIGNYAKDVLMIVTSVNILNYTERLTENFMRNIPILNRTTDDVIQGMGAGILTTAVGKAAISRCRAFGVWNKEVEKTNFVKASADFAGHVRGIFVEDVLPSLGNLWTEAWKKARIAFDKTLDKTQSATDYSKEKSTGVLRKLKKIRSPFRKEKI